MPFFSCGAIPHSFNRESPAEKMHAHLRSFSFYRKIVISILANYMPLLEIIRNLQNIRWLSIRPYKLKSLKLTIIVIFFALNRQFPEQGQMPNEDNGVHDLYVKLKIPALSI